jgi:hypothetical protein
MSMSTPQLEHLILGSWSIAALCQKCLFNHCSRMLDVEYRGVMCCSVGKAMFLTSVSWSGGEAVLQELVPDGKCVR